MTPTLIGITGFSKSGKSTVAALLGEQFRVACVAFADALKHEVARAWCIDVRVFHDPGIKDVSLHQLALARCADRMFVAAHGHLAVLDPLKPRTVMQAWGDWQNERDPGRYVRAVNSTVTLLMDTEPAAVLVTDVRLEHERAWLRAQGGLLWRVVRPGQTHPPSGHATERLQMHWPVDAEIVNGGTTEQLAKIARDLFLDATVPTELRGTP